MNNSESRSVPPPDIETPNETNTAERRKADPMAKFVACWARLRMVLSKRFIVQSSTIHAAATPSRILLLLCNKVTIDGIVYMLNNLNVKTPAPSIIRFVNTNSPIKGAQNPYINCGQDAQFASLAGNANPGSQLEILWVGGTDDSSNWPHNTGPLMHYMTKCDGSCSTYNSTNSEWFKISELCLEADGNTWYQANLTPANVTIPNTLAPGNYLLRSEIISLRLAMSPGGAEFYPACIQL
ncbi:glycosyl hydrolase family 61-domain-containing protein [Suillus discolor]|uniref:lytic cellulose monooxygenase (C4-dehydrogenating) n=1 Tax=Suillus discolor TaxID=1912936 RepID=A0A9P7ES59_9AGAM|nr:glycosyl hydrolase family 61-domain-containing protein [Suillus discolor]KAG2087910.1 glycosyl hydrolase family 61-domain-containing protein [Suillus discolor]